jgi:hypothetical protein
MSDSDTATTYLFAPGDIVWDKTDLGPKFWLSDNLVGTDYTSAFSAQLTKFGPGGGSPPHTHTYNHAFYFLRGTCRVQIGEQTWQSPTPVRKTSSSSSSTTRLRPAPRSANRAALERDLRLRTPGARPAGRPG